MHWELVFRGGKPFRELLRFHRVGFFYKQTSKLKKVHKLKLSFACYLALGFENLLSVINS